MGDEEGGGGDVGGTDRDEAVREPLLARVPEWVVALGAGALLASTLITLGAAAFTGYSITAGRYYGYQPWQIGLATLQFGAATIFQAAGVYFARRRVRWMIVMLAAILGSLTFIALPFSFVALVCVGIGKYHFAQTTPAALLRGDED